MCEIIPIDIKSASNDSMRCLVFKVNKGEIPLEKRKSGSQKDGMMGDETIGEMMNTEGEGLINHEQMIMMGMSGGNIPPLSNNDFQKSPHSFKGHNNHNHNDDEGS